MFYRTKRFYRSFFLFPPSFFSPFLLALSISFVKTFFLKRLLHTFCFLLLVACSFFSCTTIDLYEKTVNIPRHEWQSSFRPSFDFMVKDTSVSYRIFLVLRHNEKYNYNNIYVNLYVKRPGQDTAIKIQRDLTLATDEKGWLTEGIDDIYEHRLELAGNERLQAGPYTFTIEQVMREDPLQNVLNVGLRLEKQKQ